MDQKGTVARRPVRAGHPFLLAAYSALILLTANLEEARFDEAMTTLMMAVAGAGLLYGALRLVLRGQPSRAGLLASLLLAVGLFYGYPAAAVSWLLAGIAPVFYIDLALLFVTFVLMSVAIAFVLGTRRRLDRLDRILNIVTLALVIASVVQIGLYERRQSGIETFVDMAVDSDPVQNGPRVNPSPANAGPPRHIFYLVFDRYAGPTTMAPHFKFANQDFLEFLKARRFFIASQSRSNYLKTAPSLASTFHLEYINFLGDEVGKESDSWHPIYRMLRRNRVARFLKDKGYSFIQIGSWWRPTRRNDYADHVYSDGVAEFERVYIGVTIAGSLMRLFRPANPIFDDQNWDFGQCRRVPRTFETLEELSQRSEPTFVFAHILVPHPPYVFDEQGNCKSEAESEGQALRENYLDQVKYINGKIKELVSSLLADPDDLPLIILQSDEGPFPERYEMDKYGFDWRQATPEELRLKTAILNAYYLPNVENGLLYDGITPINTFRVVFNSYFGTNFALLPDRTYAFVNGRRPYDLFDVTEKVR
jgi:hypothetical protein